MPYDAKAIANYFLELAKRDGITDVSPMKLQKLVYFAHAWYLALSEEPLLSESVEAWDYGPVVESLYHAFKQFGSRPITTPAVDDQTGLPVPRPTDPDVVALLDEVWRIYRGFSATRLSDMTHRPGSPWQTTRNQQPGRHTAIPDDAIANYFRNLLESANERKRD